MGRPTRNQSDPIFQLRKRLGVKEPVTQREFAELTGIPLSTLESLSSGRLKVITKSVLQKIESALWAVWDGNRWIFKHSFPPEEFTYELFQQYRAFITGRAPIPDTDREIIKLRIDALFDCVPKQSWMKLFWRIQEKLAEARDALGLDNLKELFHLSEDQIHFSPATSWTAKPLQRTYTGLHTERDLKAYYRRCAKRYAALAKRGNRPRTFSDPWRLDLNDELRDRVLAEEQRNV
jgi:transcriptional regulator with XRE-family HTH domain